MHKLLNFVILVIFLPEFLISEDVEISKTILASAGQFPANVAIQVKDEGTHICSGMLVDLGNLVTAAECIIDRKKKDLVVVGGSDEMVENQSIGDMFVHPDYANGSLEYNIAILKLTKSFTQTTHVHPAVLAKEKPKDDDVCFVAGFAPTTPGRGTYSMFYSKVHTMKMELCRKCAENTLCAGNNVREGGCIEDRGSPLLCNGVLHGIYVGGAKNCQTASGLYTDIVFFKDWIKIIMAWNGYGPVPLPNASVRKMQITSYSNPTDSGQTSIESMKYLVGALATFWPYLWSIYVQLGQY